MSDEPTPPQSAKLFPGREFLYVIEASRVLGLTQQEVVALVDEYERTAGVSGLAGKVITNRNGNGPNYYRVSAAAVDERISRREAL